MDDLLRVRLAADGGVVVSAQLARLGLDANAARRLVRRGDLVRVRCGAFVDGEVWERADLTTRHGLTARAVLTGLDAYAASHLTALVLHGLPVLTTDLGEVHVVQVGRGRARRSGALRVHPAVPASSVTTRQRVAVVTPAVAVLQAADLSLRAGLVGADAGLRTGLVTSGDLCALARSGPARQVAALASPHSESPGESWTRLVLAGLGVEAEQQVEIRDRDGRFVARVDFLVRAAGLVIEFDGAVKYAGAEGRDALVREKRREDALRALGYRVVRITWADLRDPARLVRLLRPAAA